MRTQVLLMQEAEGHPGWASFIFFVALSRHSPWHASWQILLGFPKFLHFISYCTTLLRTSCVAYKFLAFWVGPNCVASSKSMRKTLLKNLQCLWFLCYFCFLVFIPISVEVGGFDMLILILLFAFLFSLRSFMNTRICLLILLFFQVIGVSVWLSLLVSQRAASLCLLFRMLHTI